MAAFQYLILLAPGDFDSNPPLALKEFVNFFEQSKVQVIITSYGSGELASQWGQLSQTSKWVEHQLIPRNEPESGSAFTLQNEWLQQYFNCVPGYGSVLVELDQLPAVPDLSGLLKGKQQPAQNATLSGPTDFDNLSHGVDVPVFIETGAVSAVFVLSEPKRGNIQFDLLSPKGKIINQDTPGISISRPTDDVTWYNVPEDLLVGGRWILRLQRINSLEPLAYFLSVATQHELLNLETKIEVSGPQTKFECRVNYRYPLDFVNISIALYPGGKHDALAGSPLQTFVLPRQRFKEPYSQQLVALSTGRYQTTVALEPGHYVAVFRISNSGRAVYASNISGSFNGSTFISDDSPIPNFDRVAVKRFVVTN